MKRDSELAAMQRISRALDSLELGQRKRVVTWLVDKIREDLSAKAPETEEEAAIN